MSTAKLGERIRTYRERRGLTQVDLAERAGVSPAVLCALEEQGQTLSLGPLIKVARALGVRLGTFLDDEAGRDLCLVRACDLAAGDDASRQARGKRRQLTFHSLGAGKTDRHMEPFFIVIEPEEPGRPRELSSHEGEEFIVVTKGLLEVVLGQERHLLSPGDTIYFNSVVPHHVGCAGPERTEIHAVLYFPA